MEWISFLLGMGLMSVVTTICLVLIACKGNEHLRSSYRNYVTSTDRLIELREEANILLRQLIEVVRGK